MKVKKLKNGLNLLMTPMKGTKTVTILIMVGVGSKYENKNNNGIAHFLEHMIFKGTQKRPSALAISAELDQLGGEYNAFTGKEYTGYWTKVDFKKIKDAFDILSDMFNNSTFKSAEINREKGVIIEELNMYQDNPMMFIEDLFEQCLYGDTPAGWDTIGTKENILNFQRKDFVDFFENLYAPQNTFISIAGNFSIKEAELLATKYFITKQINKRGKNFYHKKVTPEQQTRPQIKFVYKNTDQVNLSLGVRAFSYGAKDDAILRLLAVILGGSMSSRLFMNLRERNGLAYYVRTGYEFYSDTGYLTTQAGVPAQALARAIQIILKEYKRLKKELVSKEELERAKDMLAGKTAIQFELSDNIANFYARQAVLIKESLRLGQEVDKKYALGDLRILSPEENLHKLQKVKASDIKRVANKIFFNNNLNLAFIGPHKNAKEFQKILKL